MISLAGWFAQFWECSFRSIPNIFDLFCCGCRSVYKLENPEEASW